MHILSYPSFQSCDFKPNVQEKIGPGVKSSDEILTQLISIADIISSHPERSTCFSTLIQTLSESSLPFIRLKICSIALCALHQRRLVASDYVHKTIWTLTPSWTTHSRATWTFQFGRIFASRRVASFIANTDIGKTILTIIMRSKIVCNLLEVVAETSQPFCLKIICPSVIRIACPQISEFVEIPSCWGFLCSYRLCLHMWE